MKKPQIKIECTSVKVVGNMLIRNEDGKVVGHRQVEGEMMQADFSGRTVEELATAMEAELVRQLQAKAQPAPPPPTEDPDA